MHHKLMLAVLCGLASAPAFAAEMTAGDLFEFCVSRDPVNHDTCRFFILGATQAFGMSNGVGDKGLRVCVPENTSDAAMVKQFQDMAAIDFTAFPQDRQMPAVALVGAVMTKAYPCKPK